MKMSTDCEMTTPINTLTTHTHTYLHTHPYTHTLELQEYRGRGVYGNIARARGPRQLLQDRLFKHANMGEDLEGVGGENGR